jgi:hypothetical protein
MEERGKWKEEDLRSHVGLHHFLDLNLHRILFGGHNVLYFLYLGPKFPSMNLESWTKQNFANGKTSTVSSLKINSPR